MESKTPTASIDDEVNATAVIASKNRSTKGKVPKRIHKAAREKLKREHLNELFLELANALELSDQQNNGKAYILSDATRFLKDLFGQIESLKKENVSLLSESHYVAVERNELKEENSMLETQISKLQTEIQTRVNGSKPDLDVCLPTEYGSQQPELASSHFPTLPPLHGSSLQQPSPAPAAAVLVLPLQSDLQAYQMPDTTGQTQTQESLKRNSNVSKPHPRYPSAADSWQSQLLNERLRVSDEVGIGGASSRGVSRETKTVGL